MKKITKSFALISMSILLFACGGEERRSTSNSNDLTGLWRTQLKSSQIGLSATSNISYTLRESNSGVEMVSCIDRSRIDLQKEQQQLSGLPIGPVTIINNDTISGNGNFGQSNGSKMALPVQFDMGNLSISGAGFGSIRFTDICVVSSEAKVLGTTSSEEYSAGVIYRGQPMEVKISVMGNIGTRTYGVTREPSSGEARITLRSEALRDTFNRTEMDLRNGTLTINEDGLVNLVGEFSAYMPNGNRLIGSFTFEKP